MQVTIFRKLKVLFKLHVLFHISSFFSSQFARQFSRDEPLTFGWVCRHIGWPVPAPKNIKDLVHLEAVHDVLDLYLWLRY